MGGRGASSGVSTKGIPYGKEYRTLHAYGNIKFIIDTMGNSRTPLETMTKGRVYVLISNKTHKIKSINYYDAKGKRRKSVHLDHHHHGLQEHRHDGYYHNKHEAHRPDSKEWAMIERVRKIWEDAGL